MILIVEDHQPTSHALVSILRDKGYEATATTSGRVDLDLIEALRPHLILLDVQMNDSTTLEMLQALQINPEYSDLDVIVFTANRLVPSETDSSMANVLKSTESMEGLWEQIQKYVGEPFHHGPRA